MPAIAEQIATGRVIRFAFKEAMGSSHRNRRREQVATYVESWMQARIVSELYGTRRCYLVVAVARPVSLTSAEAFARACPGYVAGSCEIIGE
jgi:hypothetical protein